MLIKTQAIFNDGTSLDRVVFFKGQAFEFAGTALLLDEQNFMGFSEDYFGVNEEIWVKKHFDLELRGE